jgi:2-alkenal reductase
MSDRLIRLLLLIAVVLLAVTAAQPHVERWLYATDTPRPVAPRADLTDLEKSSVQLFRTIAPSVVQVAVQTSGMRAGAGEGGAASGTGFVWDGAGHIVTNNHVVENAGVVAVRFASGRVMRADIVGRAPNYDLAVLRLESSASLPAPVPVGTSADLAVGQLAYAIGNPFGLDQSLSFGIISALKRRLPTAGGREIADVIQTDAAINPGNSGGPLLDSAGRLIGVNTAIFSPSGANAGIGFAIPADVVNRVVPQLIRAGRVPTPGIGIMAADESIATRLGLTGIVVAGVVPGSPAERAGLAGFDRRAGTIGDVIVAADGKPVRHLSDLTDALEARGVGATMALTTSRGGSERRVEVTIADIGEK